MLTLLLASVSFALEPHALARTPWPMSSSLDVPSVSSSVDSATTAPLAAARCTQVRRKPTDNSGSGTRAYGYDGRPRLSCTYDWRIGLLDRSPAKEAGFTGHRVESALGLSYAEQRWLDSSTGTWLSRDDIGAASYLQSPNELNPWLYAAGNPTRYTDPDGRRLPWPTESHRIATLFALVTELWAEYSGQHVLIQAIGSTGKNADEVAAYRRGLEAAIARAQEDEPVLLTGQQSGFALYPSQSVLAMRGLDDEKGLNEHGAAWFPKGAQFSTASGAWASSNVSSGGRPRSVVDVNNPADKRLNSTIGGQMNRIRGELLKLPDDVVRLEYILSIEGP